jgi:hypothetical protein
MQLAAGETCFDRIVSSVQFAEIHQPAHRQTLQVFLPGFEELLDVVFYLRPRIFVYCVASWQSVWSLIAKAGRRNHVEP